MNSASKSLHSIAIIFVILTFSGVASAEKRWEAGLSVSRMQFDSEFSRQAGIGGDAWKVSGELGFNLHEYFMLGGGIGLLFLDDKKRLTENALLIDITNRLDVPFTAQSDETGESLFGFGRVEYPFIKDIFSGNIIAGYEYLSFERELDNIIGSTIQSEKVHIDAGVYFGGGISLSPPIQHLENLKLRFQYQTYVGEDVDGQYSFGIGFPF